MERELNAVAVPLAFPFKFPAVQKEDDPDRMEAAVQVPDDLLIKDLAEAAELFEFSGGIFDQLLYSSR